MRRDEDGVPPRRRARIARGPAPAVAAVAFALLLGGVAAVQLGQRDAPAPAASATSPAAGHRAGTGQPAGTATLRLAGVEVTVPAAWLDRERVRCGRGVKDAAYVLDPRQLTCRASVNRSAVTEVVMSAYTSSADIAPPRAPHKDADGRWSQRWLDEDRRVAVTVSSPRRRTLMTILSTLRVLAPNASVEGCPVRQAVPDGKPRSGRAADPRSAGGAVVPAAPLDAVVCAYDGEWIGTSGVLSQPPARDLAAALDAARPAPLANDGAPVFDCAPQPVPTRWLTLRFRIPPTPAGPDPALRTADVYVVACPDGTAAYATGPAGPAVTPPPDLIDRLYRLR